MDFRNVEPAFLKLHTKYIPEYCKELKALAEKRCKKSEALSLLAGPGKVRS